MPAPQEFHMEDAEMENNGDLPDEKMADTPVATKNDLRKLIEETENAPLKENDIWFVISLRWWSKLVTAVRDGFIEDIGQIDNSPISERSRKGDNYLKSRLSEGVDYQTVPGPVFERLRQIFTLDDDSRDYIPRRVVTKNGQLVIEVYPRVVHIALARNRNIKADLTLLPNDTMQTLKDRACAELSIEANGKVRFYVMNGDNPELVDTEQSLDSYFDTAQNVLVDTEVRGQFFYEAKSALQPQSKSLFGQSNSNSNSSVGNGSFGNFSASGSVSGNACRTSPGQCGLSNLGNTCFMASALQCLSNTPPLREYFLSDEYMLDLNVENPLGTEGNLAQAVGDLFKSMWSGQFSSVNPRKFKAIIGQFAPRFNGYSQQDSHELMAYVLDGLHEDLNRIKKKPYIEDNDELAKLQEAEHAAKAWELYKMRNDSIIVDTLHGQLKSTLICPVCAKISIKFDPFGYLSLPLPAKEDLTKVTVVIMFLERKWAKFSLSVVEKTTVSEADEMMRVKLQPELNHHLVFFYIPNSLNDEVVLLNPSDPIGHAQARDKVRGEVYAAEVNDDPNAPGTKLFVAYNRYKISRGCSLPMIYSIKSEAEFTRSYLTKHVLGTTSRFFFTDKNALEMADPDDDSMNGNEDREPFKLYIQPACSTSQLPVPPTDDPLGWPDGSDPYKSYQQISFQWKDIKIFNQYKGADLIEREMTVQTRRKVELMETLEWFTTKEQLGEHDLWYCPECKKHERATKQLELWKLPEILILHLKRFQYTRWSREKLTWEVVIPVKGLDLTSKVVNPNHEKAVYDLIAISRHYGSLSGGHYTACAYNDKISKWIDFNDASASTCSGPADPYEAADPYMLVYRRRPVNSNGEPVEKSLADGMSQYHRANNNKRATTQHHVDENMEMEED